MIRDSPGEQNINIIKNNIETLLNASMKVGQDKNAYRTKHMFTSQH